MRPRLVNPFYASIARIDYAGGETAGDFDDDFGEVKTKTVSGQRVVERPESAAVKVRCQIEDEEFRSLHMFDAGDSPEAKIGIVCDMTWLARNGYVGADGLSVFGINDRLVQIVDHRGNKVHDIANPPGLYCVEARPISYGIGRRLRLLLLRYNDRAQTQQT